jgi:hypothetical protein
MGELSLRTVVPGAACVGGCLMERLETFEVEDGAEDDASRLRRAFSSFCSLTLDFSSSTLRPFLFTEYFENREKFSQ